MTERILDQLCGQRDCVPVFHPDSGDPLHGESMIAVREELDLHFLLPRDVTDDSQHVTLRVLINKKLLMKMPKDATPSQRGLPRRGARGRVV